MAANYVGLNKKQCERYDVLVELCREMGEHAFSALLIDILASHGSTVSIHDLPHLAVVWQARQRLAA